MGFLLGGNVASSYDRPIKSEDRLTRRRGVASSPTLQQFAALSATLAVPQPDRQSSPRRLTSSFDGAAAKFVSAVKTVEAAVEWRRRACRRELSAVSSSRRSASSMSV